MTCEPLRANHHKLITAVLSAASVDTIRSDLGNATQGTLCESRRSRKSFRSRSSPAGDCLCQPIAFAMPTVAANRATNLCGGTDRTRTERGPNEDRTALACAAASAAICIQPAGVSTPVRRCLNWLSNQFSVNSLSARSTGAAGKNKKISIHYTPIRR